MRLPRRVPWAHITELEQLCVWIYAEEEDLDTKSLAINRLSAWKAVTSLPHALDSALSLLVACMLDVSCRDTLSAKTALSLRQNYATAIIRMVNGLVDPLQSGAYARSIAAIATQLGLPSWLVELRHAATHEDLPSLELLREAGRESLSWLYHNYFQPTLYPSAPTSTASLPARPIAPLLKTYKVLMKTVVRDGSLRKQYQDKVDAVMRDIERWIAEALVSAELAVNAIGWGLNDDTFAPQTDAKEKWALELVCDALLEKGGIVPVAKRKCCAHADPFLPTTASLSLWTPLLMRLYANHPTFPSIFVNRIISILSDDLTGESEDKDVSEPNPKQPPRSAIYCEYLARWVTWAAQTWTNESEHGTNLRKDVIFQVASTFTPGYDFGNKTRMLDELLRAVSVGFKDLEDCVNFLRSTHVPVPTQKPWELHDLVDMEERLQKVIESQTSELDQNYLAEESRVTQPGGIVDAGWKLLDGSNWAPCPIGVYYGTQHS